LAEFRRASNELKSTIEEVRAIEAEPPAATAPSLSRRSSRSLSQNPSLTPRPLPKQTWMHTEDLDDNELESSAKMSFSTTWTSFAAG
jgi:hypothetical protein